MKKIGYYSCYPVEAQKKFLELILNGSSFSDALEQSELDEDCVRDWCYEDNEIVDSDIEKCWEAHECNFEIADEYRVYISFEEAACYDYNPLEGDLEFEVTKVDKEVDNKKRLNWIEERKKEYNGDFEKFAEFVYNTYVEV